MQPTQSLRYRAVVNDLFRGQRAWGWGATAVVLTLFFTLKAPSFCHSHRENDERIYLNVASNLWRTGNYRIGRDAPRWLVQHPRYARPLFHHPPLFVALIAPFAATGWESGALLVSIFGHLLCVVALWVMIGAARSATGPDASGFAAGYPLLALAFDPLLTHTTTRIWIDGLMAGLVSMALAIALWASTRKDAADKRYWFLSGLLCGLAGLCKLSGLLLVPVLVVLAFSGWRRAPREAIMRCVLLAVGPIVLVGPWIWRFYSVFDTLLPSWLAANAAERTSPYFRQLLSRPAYFYLVAIFSFHPLLVPGWLTSSWDLLRKRELPHSVLAFWPMFYLLAISLYVATTVGFASRHLAPVMPTLYFCLYLVLRRAERRSPFLRTMLALSFVSAALQTTYYLFTPWSGDTLTLWRLIELTRMFE